MDTAFVTLATNDQYAIGALVLASSLRLVKTASAVVCMITPEVTQQMRQVLEKSFNQVYLVDVLDSRDTDNLFLLDRPNLGVTFTKLHCWRLDQYKKCVFLDADTLVLSNCDELFKREELSAAPDPGWPDCFNSGVFVYAPSKDTYKKLVEFAVNQGSFDGADQGLLNLYFADWSHKDISKHLPFLYNVVSQAFYSYLPAFKRFGNQTKICHFIGPVKPWHHGFNEHTGAAIEQSGTGFNSEFLQKWWQIFMTSVRPFLTQSHLSGAAVEPSVSPHTLMETEVVTELKAVEYDSALKVMRKRVAPSSADRVEPKSGGGISEVPLPSILETEAKAPEASEASAAEAFEAKAPEAKADKAFEANAVKSSGANATETSEVKAPDASEAKAADASEAKADDASEAKADDASEVKAVEASVAAASADEVVANESPPSQEEIYQLWTDNKIPYKLEQCSFQSILDHIEQQVDDSTTVKDWGTDPAPHTADAQDSVMPQLAGLSLTYDVTAADKQQQVAIGSPRQENWERGIIDYTGVDSFEEIKKHIDQSLSAEVEPSQYVRPIITSAAASAISPEIPDVRPKVTEDPDVRPKEPKASKPMKSALKKPKE